MHVVQLGHIAEFDGLHNMAVQDPLTRKSASYDLTPEALELLLSLDPTETGRVFTPEEHRLLEICTALRMVALVEDGAALSELSFIPAPRYDVVLDAILDDGYRFSSEVDEPFELSEYGARLMSRVDGRKTLGEIALAVKQEALADEEDRAAIRVGEVELQQTFDECIEDEVFRFIAALRGREAVTFEATAEEPA
ncbi:hypothetical protein [Clavibacter sp. VKM Ac-2872]|uniref:hypothetical protein n=1 Tax=Clavibacter sp. VKM Ac-2872 TaxID=2783812 RepID=UPI00188BD51D|nr:hypothetical protein [Clavibacter sp. VKM Ac-2872]MBF4625627.1 hypothetical protein [Clavibacter sp. VKM Ac-2872]